MNSFKSKILKFLQAHPKIFNPLWEYLYWPFVKHDKLDEGFDGTATDVFTRIHDSNYWGSGESVSGPGSEIAFTKNLRGKLSALFSEKALESMFDAPCGDCNWVSKVAFPSGFHYMGGDIVEALVERNKYSVNFSNPSISATFKVFDIRKDELPDVDIWLCRDVFFHMPTSDILLALNNFKRSKIEYLLTTNFYFPTKNIDAVSGGYRHINLCLDPFNLPKPLSSYSDYVIPHAPRYLELWHRDQLENLKF